MEKHPLDLLEYYEHQIRAAAQATASVALLQDADRLLERIKKATCGCSSNPWNADAYVCQGTEPARVPSERGSGQPSGFHETD